MTEKQSDFHQQPNYIETISESGQKNVHHDVFLPYLPEEYKIIAEKELNETEENKVNGVAALKESLKKKCITCPDDNELITVLRWCKYNIKKAEKKIVKYLETHNFILKNVRTVDERKIKVILDDLVFGVLPYTAQDGSVIVSLRASLNLEAYDCDDVSFCIGAFLIYLHFYPITTVTGVSVLIDCEAPLYLMYPVSKAYIRHTKHVFNFPIRIKRIDVVNENFIVRWCYNILRPIFPSKLLKKILFHGDSYNSLVKQYHPDILPHEFGGTLELLNNKYLKERFLPFIEELKRKECI